MPPNAPELVCEYFHMGSPLHPSVYYYYYYYIYLSSIQFFVRLSRAIHYVCTFCLHLFCCSTSACIVHPTDSSASECRAGANAKACRVFECALCLFWQTLRQAYDVNWVSNLIIFLWIILCIRVNRPLFLPLMLVCFVA